MINVLFTVKIREIGYTVIRIFRIKHFPENGAKASKTNNTYVVNSNVHCQTTSDHSPVHGPRVLSTSIFYDNYSCGCKFSVCIL